MITGASHAAEFGKGIYLLGSKNSMAGVVPPSGTYLTSETYIYSGNAGASETIPDAGRLVADIDAFVVLELPILLWVAPQQVAGANLGLGIMAPFGYAKVSAATEFATPGGVASFGVGDDSVTFGDPVLLATLGWSEDPFFWNVYSLLNVPIGDYETGRLSNIAFHRWAGDLGLAATWLDASTGLEVSASVGFTLNGENPKTDYRTGTEFHAEYAALKHVGQEFAFGVAGYHYQQISGDSGPGAVLGSFEGRATALGPIVSVNALFGAPVNMKVRLYREFDVENRLEATTGFITFAVPL